MKTGIILFLFSWSASFAQTTDPDVTFLKGKSPVRLSFSVLPSITSFGNQSPFVWTGLSGQVSWNQFVVESQIFLNHNQSFSVKNPPLLINLPAQGTIANPSSIVNPPNSLDFQFPLSLGAKWTSGQFSLSGSMALLSKKTVIQNPQIINLEENIYSVSWKPENKSAVSGIFSFSGSWNWNLLTFTAGVNGLTVPFSSKTDTSYQMKPKVSPLVGILFGSNGTQAEAKWMSSRLGFYGKTKPGFKLFGDSKPEIKLGYETGTSRFSWQRASFELSVPLTRIITMVTAGDWVFGNKQALSDQNFRDFLTLQAANPKPIHTASTLSIGFIFSFDASERNIPVRLMDSRFYQSSVYTAKRSFYTYNPVGTVDLYNTSEDPAEFELVIRSKNKLASYQSGKVSLAPSELKSVPVFLYLPDTSLSGIPVNDQMEVTAETENLQKRLTTFPITVYDRNSWDGDTYSLKYFLSTQDPDLLSFSKSAYLAALNDSEADSSVNPSLKILERFLSEAGEKLRYIPDPTTTFVTDRVQYPAETLRRKSGDCEDLVVFAATSLMTVGFNCAVVDIRPKLPEKIPAPTAASGSIGHVFLLVDTQIPVVQAGNTGLGEFQFVTRRNKTGEFTIWIPIETTVLSEGFKKAFTEGVRQYYDEVIVNSGVEKGHVQIYDL